MWVLGYACVTDEIMKLRSIAKLGISDMSNPFEQGKPTATPKKKKTNLKWFGHDVDDDDAYGKKKKWEYKHGLMELPEQLNDHFTDRGEIQSY